MKIVKGLLVVVMVILFNEGRAQSSELVKVPIHSRNNNPSGYIQYLPPSFDASGNTKYPILYWLHGLGEIGNGSASDLEEIINTQICQWLKTNSRDFIILVPQDVDGYWNGSPTRLKSFVDWANTEYGKYINTGQQHLAGLSAGGYGIRDFILENSSAYKAIATITFMSTNVNLINGYAATLVSNNQYVWFHHGYDDVVPNTVNDVRTLHNRILEIDSTRSRLTVYYNLGHGAWDMVYNGLGKSAPQVTGTVAKTKYYSWTLGDIDKDWFAWMKASGKTPVAGDTPSAIQLTHASLAENNAIDTSIGKLKANGYRPSVFSLKSNTGDNAMFYISNDQLRVNSVFDYETKQEYSVTVIATNVLGSFTQNFVIAVDDVFEEVPLETESTFTASTVELFPNPVSQDYFFVKTLRDDVFVSSIEWIGVRGERATTTIDRYLCHDEPLRIQLPQTAGFYFVRINFTDRSEVIKVIRTP